MYMFVPIGPNTVRVDTVADSCHRKFESVAIILNTNKEDPSVLVPHPFGLKWLTRMISEYNKADKAPEQEEPRFEEAVPAISLTAPKLNIDLESGAFMIAEERQRQIEEEHYTAEADDVLTFDQIPSKALAYLTNAIRNNGFTTVDTTPVDYWPGTAEDFKPSPDPVRDLVRAGALIAAEIDRIHREREKQA